MAKRSAEPVAYQPAQLRVSLAEAQRLLDQQIAKGFQIEVQFKGVRAETIVHAAQAWHEANGTILDRILTTPEEAVRYSNRTARYVVAVDGDEYEEARDDHGERLRFLRSLRERLEFFAIAPGVTPGAASAAAEEFDPADRRVFLVHGHDDSLKAEVAHFLRRLGLEPIILHEEPDGGEYLFEKFRRNARVPFAVVLMTPDDEAMGRRRARQNVILEFGFFLATLGPKRVRALCHPDVERPSDAEGWLYIPVNEKWRAKLAQELLAAGYTLDQDRVLKATLA